MIFVYITFGVVLLWALLTGNLWNIIVGVFALAFIVAIGIVAFILIADNLEEAKAVGIVLGVLFGILFALESIDEWLARRKDKREAETEAASRDADIAAAVERMEARRAKREDGQ